MNETIDILAFSSPLFHGMPFKQHCPQYACIYYTCMDDLPEVVRVALQNACESGRTLSWKVQEGTLIQLPWKQIPIVCLDEGHSISMVGSKRSWISQLKRLFFRGRTFDLDFSGMTGSKVKSCAFNPSCVAGAYKYIRTLYYGQ